MELREADINGVPGVVVHGGGEVLTVLTACVENGRITGIHLVSNPDKLHAVADGLTRTVGR